jgi:hypothetical protein
MDTQGGMSTFGKVAGRLARRKLMEAPSRRSPLRSTRAEWKTVARFSALRMCFVFALSPLLYVAILSARLHDSPDGAPFAENAMTTSASLLSATAAPYSLFFRSGTDNIASSTCLLMYEWQQTEMMETSITAVPSPAKWIRMSGPDACGVSFLAQCSHELRCVSNSRAKTRRSFAAGSAQRIVANSRGSRESCMMP